MCYNQARICNLGSLTDIYVHTTFVHIITLTREKSSFLCWTNTKPQKGNNTISKLGTAPVEHT